MADLWQICLILTEEFGIAYTPIPFFSTRTTPLRVGSTRPPVNIIFHFARSKTDPRQRILKMLGLFIEQLIPSGIQMELGSEVLIGYS